MKKIFKETFISLLAFIAFSLVFPTFSHAEEMKGKLSELTVTGLTPSQVVFTDAGKKLASQAPAALTKTNDTNVTLTLGGTPNTSLLQPVSLTLGWTGTLADGRITSAAIWNAKEPAISTGASGTYWRGDKTWQSLKQSNVDDLRTTDGPTFAHLHLSDLTAVYTAAESWIGPSSTTGMYFKSGLVGIGTTGPLAQLDISSATRSGTQSSAVKGLYVTGNFGAASGGVEFRHSNATQGIGFGYNTIYAAGSATDQNIGMTAKGAGNAFLHGLGVYLYVGATNGYVSTDGSLIVSGTINSSFAGNVGFNTTSPGSTVDIKGILRLTASDGTYNGFATAAGTTSKIYTLPTVDGSSGYVLQTNGSGVLSFAAPTGTAGTHDGTDDSAFFHDSTKSWTTSQWVGYTIKNLTDASSCVITANDSHTATCTLTGGSENLWDIGDNGVIVGAVGITSINGATGIAQTIAAGTGIGVSTVGNTHTISYNPGATLTLGVASTTTGTLKLYNAGEAGYTTLQNTASASNFAAVLPPVSGTLATGTGTATYATFWSGTNALSSDADFTWDNTNKILYGKNLKGNNVLFQDGADTNYPLRQTLTTLTISRQVAAGTDSIGQDIFVQSIPYTTQTIWGLSVGIDNYGTNTSGNDGAGVGVWSYVRAYGTGEIWGFATYLEDQVGSHASMVGTEIQMARQTACTDPSIGLALVAGVDGSSYPITYGIHLAQFEGSTGTFQKGLYAEQSAIGTGAGDSFMELKDYFRIRRNGTVLIGGGETSQLALSTYGDITAGDIQWGAAFNSTLSGTSKSSMLGIGGEVKASTAIIGWYGVEIGNPDLGSGALIGTQYSLFIQTPIRGSTNYALYSEGGANYFGGNAVMAAGLTLTGFSGFVKATAGVLSAAALVDADIPNDITLTNITQITNRSHTSLSDIGTLSHATIDSYLDQAVKQASNPTFAGLNSTSSILMNNLVNLQGKDTYGVAKQLIGMGNDNIIYLGVYAPCIDIGALSSNNNPVYIRVGGVNTKQVLVGAADSGGTGYRMLRVTN